MLRNLNLPQKGMLVLAVALVVQISFIVLLALMHLDARSQIKKEERVQSTIAQMNVVSNLWSSLMTDSFRNMISRKTRSESFFSGYYRKELAQAFQVLDTLVDDENERKEIGILETNTNAALTMLIKLQASYKNHEDKQFREYLKEAGNLGDFCTAKSNQLIDKFLARQQASHEAQLRSQSNLNLAISVGLSLNFLMVLFVAYLFTNGIAHRITKIADNSLRLASGEPLHPALSGTDEISRLDKDFHKMADALTEAARKERAVVDNAQDLICSLDAEGVFRMVNPAAEKILGRKPAELVGSSYLDLVLSADKERTRAMLKSLMSGEMTEPFEHLVLNKDGSTVDLVLSAHWSETDESLFCVMHDITLHRQTQRLKQEFTNLISDGLRVPLLSTQETLELLASGAWDEQTGINHVLDAAHQIKPMLKLLSNLLEVEKFDASMLSLDLKSLEISTPINEAISAVQQEAAEKEVTFDVHSDSALVEADRLRMVQALANLLSHAIDVSPAGSSVKVRCRADKQSVRIEITDSGASLSATEQSLIFEPLRRDLTGKDRIGGTRLGLVISKSIVEAHHGTIGIWDAKPMGSTFWIQIPAQI